jgi:hydrogenase maturation protein HypF
LRAEIKVSGIVQGVGFRPFIYQIAVKNKLVGYVQNCGDATIEIVVEGEKYDIQSFLKELETDRPPLARIHDIITTYGEGENRFLKFSIIKSSEGSELSGSVIPPDVSICDECVNELRNPKNARHNYFFITCTNCGPRYTIIERVPYDRSNTTMKEFVMCDFCQDEYSNPSNRRFHAQTVACPKCGPQAYLTNSDGESYNSHNPIQETGKLLEEGYIVAIKGYGGFHIATSTIRSEPIAKLRTVKHRAQKPFAIMASNLETVQSFAEMSTKEAELLTSHIKPIVLLKKRDSCNLSQLIAPGLHNFGVMLPYTGLHHLLFDNVKEPAFIMTSANPPNEPIITDNKEAIEKLSNIVDYFLFYNRRIAQRCDDSVIRVHEKNISIIRRSRGYAPAPVQLKWSFQTDVLGVGAELNATSCILTKNKAFLSQHIGDIENLETFNFLKTSTDHLMRLTNIAVEAVAHDLHPKFTATMLAQELGDKLNCSVVAVQHHHAHAAALMSEQGIDEIVAIVCDGYGYGADSTAWGGEILYCNREGRFQRAGHLQPQPMIGGDLAAYYPLRMATGILRNMEGIESWLCANSVHLPHKMSEAEIILQQMKHGSLPLTTSCGRILDAIAAILGICYERTYEGEPAMKLESVALKGRDVLKLESLIKNNIVDTTTLVHELFDKRNIIPIADLAFSAQSYLARSLARLALDVAERLGVNVIGFSGGVACNEHIVSVMRSIVEKNGLRFIVPELVPPGDGGISLGQAAAAAWQIETNA